MHFCFAFYHVFLEILQTSAVLMTVDEKLETRSDTEADSITAESESQ